MATIPPGGTGTFRLTFDRPMVGMRDGGLKIFSNDPIEPEKAILLRFEIAP